MHPTCPINQQTAYGELLLQYENAHHLTETCFLANQCFSQQKQPVSAKQQYAQMEGTPVRTLHILHDSQRSSVTDLTINVHKHRHVHFCVFQNVTEISVF
jgi:hypothetical protein